MTKRLDQPPITSERLERALVLLAYFIEMDGDVHLPMYEKFEAELAELKNKRSYQISRAQALRVLPQRGWRLESNPLKILALQLERRPLPYFGL
jgi:hypothetical protein